MLTPEQVHELVRSKSEYLSFNHCLIDVFENNIKKYVEQDLKNQLSLQSFTQAMHRLSPINILPKVIDKLTNIYQTAVSREMNEGNETDYALLSWYQEKMRPNVSMNLANEMYNLCNATLIYPSVYKGIPNLRVIENDRFVVHAQNPLHPTEPTQIILLAGCEGDNQIYWVYEPNAIYITDSYGKVRYDLMSANGNETGENPLGRLPFVYVNSSKRKAMPSQDRDGFRIVKLIPTMLTDLNLAAMFQSFSMIYAINLDDQQIQFTPNSVVVLKSDPTTDQKPEIGSIKPDVDFQQVLGLIEAQISMWLGTKGIKSSAIGSLTTENFASGISKIIDEMDTYEARQQQTGVFSQAEAELWDLIINSMHPYWVSRREIEVTALFTPGAYVKTKFSVQLPMQSRGQVVRDLKEEYASGFTTKRIALTKLNPELTDDEIDQLMADIDLESGVISNGSTESVTIDTGGSQASSAQETSGPGN